MGLKMCIKDFSALYNLKLDGECTANCVHDIYQISYLIVYWMKIMMDIYFVYYVTS